MTPATQFDPAAANERAARWLGWDETEEDFRKVFPWTCNGIMYKDPPNFAADANTWPQVHAELERRDLWFRYTLAVFRVVGGPQHEDANYPYFQLLEITPEQRLRALVKLIEEEE